MFKKEFNRNECRDRLTLLSTTKESSVFFHAKVNFNKVGTGEQLHDHATGDETSNEQSLMGLPEVWTYEVTMGEIPSSMRVPLLDARMTRIQ